MQDDQTGHTAPNTRPTPPGDQGDEAHLTTTISRDGRGPETTASVADMGEDHQVGALPPPDTTASSRPLA